MQDFISIDVETANSAGYPCSIAIVVVNDGKIIEEKECLINPESDFSPMNIRIHGITAENVREAPNFATAWDEISQYFSSYPVVAHNVSFDMSVINRALSRYKISPPTCQCFCTMETAKKFIQLDSYKLETLCAHFGVSLYNYHDALSDAKACAEVALKLIDAGNDLCRIKTVENKSYEIDEFEYASLRVLQEIVGEPVRYSKKKNLCAYTCFWSFVSIGKIKKGYYIPTSRDVSFCADNLLCDSTSAGNRIFLSSPDDLYLIKDFVLSKYAAAKASWDEYVRIVSDSSARKRIRAYEKESCAFIDIT